MQKRRVLVNGTSLEWAFEGFIRTKKAEGLSEATLKAYRYHFDAVAHHLDVRQDVEELKSSTVKAAIAEIAETGISPNSIRSYTATLKSFFSWCSAEGLCDVKIGLYRGSETVPETYSPDDLKTLLKRPKRRCTFAEFRSWVIVNVFVDTGMRAMSVRTLQVRDVDLDAGVIRLRHVKNRTAQVLPISPMLGKVLEEYLAILHSEPEDPLFPSVSGEPLRDEALRNSIERYERRRGVRPLGLHAFRHTFARLYLQGCDGNALKLQKLLGHSTLDMTKKYVRIFDRDLVNDFQTKSPLSVL